MAVVGHDLRTPLSSVLVSSQFLATRGGLSVDAERLVRRIAASATRMSVIIGDLVDYGRARQGLGLTLSLERVDVAELARTALNELSEPEQGRARVTASGDTVATCDPVRLVQVASNLVGNALRHGSGEPVDVRVVGSADDVVLSVHNAGPAIPAELLPHLFEPFRQASEPGANVGTTGLGLFIVREIVTAHGGSVDVVSDATAGTTFTVRIPRERRDPPR
jgi:signal transduction histidine kinase